jgi:hypothetical protein
VQTESTVTLAPCLQHAELSTLRQLGDLGHVRGILDQLDRIDSRDPRQAALTARLRRHVKAFELPEFMRVLQEVSDDTAEHS